MAASKFSKSQRQVAIRLQSLVKDLHMAGTVHGFDRKLAIIGLESEHAVSKLIRMPRALPQGNVDHLRGVNFLIAKLLLLGTHVLLNDLVNRPSCRVPKHHARGLFLRVE